MNPWFSDDEIFICDGCGEEVLLGDEYEWNGSVLCKDCLLDTIKHTFTFDNAIKEGDEEKKSIEINGFVAHFLSEVEINRILTDWCRENFDEETDVQEYAYATEGFLEWGGKYYDIR